MYDGALGLSLPIAVFDVGECLLLRFTHRLSPFPIISHSYGGVEIKSAFP